VLALLLGTMCYAADRTEVRQHGFRLDEKNRLVLEQRHRTVRIGIASRTRPVGDVPHTRTNDDTSDKVAHFGVVRYLAEVSAEVLLPSAPNYLSNPGERYRITVVGLEVDPDFVVKTEVDAGVARATFLSEMEKLRARAHGIDREALYYGAPYALEVLSSSGLMAARIPTTIRRSQVARIRTDDPTLQRRRMDTGRRVFAPKSLGKPEEERGLGAVNAETRREQR
jgi:hypothetical protein